MAHGASNAAREFRYDRGELLRARMRADGSMLLEGIAARSGIYEYLNADGTTRKELVTRECLIDSIAGLARCVATKEHPAEFVTPDNVDRHQVGDVDGDIAYSEIEGDGGFVRVKLAVRRRDALDAIHAARQTKAPVELSPGYYAAVDHTPGVDPVFGAYDAVQVAREYNHLAVLLDGRARGGSECFVRVDGADVPVAVQAKPFPSPPPSPHEDSSMNVHLLALASLLAIKADGLDEAALVTQISDALKGLQTEAGKTAGLQVQVDGYVAADKARADKVEREQLDALAKDLGIETKADQKNDEVKTAIAKHELGDKLPAQPSTDFLNGIVLAARARVDASPGINPWGDFTPVPKKDGKPETEPLLDLDAVVRKQIHDARNAA